MSERPNQTNRPYQTNITLQVQQFDLSAPNGGVVRGRVLTPPHMAGQETAIRLLTQEECNNGFLAGKDPRKKAAFHNRRPTVEGYANGWSLGKDRNVDPFPVGGIMMFHGATIDQEASTQDSPVWKAEYLENYGAQADRSVIHGAARVSIQDYTDKGTGALKTYANIDLLQTDRARQIKGHEDLNQFFATNMTSLVHEVGVREMVAIQQPIAVLRVLDVETGGVFSRMAYTQNVEKEVEIDGVLRKITAPGDGMDNYLAAVVNGEQGRGFFRVLSVALGNEDLAERLKDQEREVAAAISEGLTSGRYQVEAIPGFRLPIVAKSLEEVLDSSKPLGRTAEKCFLKEQDDAGKWFVPENPKVGFLKMTVGLMQVPSRNPNGPGGVIVSRFTEDEFAYPYSQDMLATPAFRPAWAMRFEDFSRRQAEQAAEQGGVPQQDYPGMSGDNPELAASAPPKDDVAPEAPVPF